MRPCSLVGVPAPPTVTNEPETEHACSGFRAHERTANLGVTYTGIKNLSLSGTILDLPNDCNRSNGIPSASTCWLPGLAGALGRRLSLRPNYKLF